MKTDRLGIITIVLLVAIIVIPWLSAGRELLRTAPAPIVNNAGVTATAPLMAFQANHTETPSQTDEAVTAAATTYSWGSYGETVRTIQTKLKNWGYLYGNVDGKFGYQTYEAVRHFQRKNGLTADGVVGGATLKALGMASSSESSSSQSAHGKDKNMLAAAIYSEARGEPYTGQVAIGAVIMNRARHPSFPNTIAGVIYQKGAFEAVSNGQINLTPNETAYKAATDALSGWDPTNGALYYWNPKTATSSWIWSVPVTYRIGNHIFGKK